MVGSMSGLNSSGVNSSGVNYNGVNSSGVNSGVNLSGVNSSGVNLSGVDPVVVRTVELGFRALGMVMSLWRARSGRGVVVRENVVCRESGVVGESGMREGVVVGESGRLWTERYELEHLDEVDEVWRCVVEARCASEVCLRALGVLGDSDDDDNHGHGVRRPNNNKHNTNNHNNNSNNNNNNNNNDNNNRNDNKNNDNDTGLSSDSQRYLQNLQDVCGSEGDMDLDADTECVVHHEEQDDEGEEGDKMDLDLTVGEADTTGAGGWALNDAGECGEMLQGASVCVNEWSSASGGNAKCGATPYGTTTTPPTLRPLIVGGSRGSHHVIRPQKGKQPHPNRTASIASTLPTDILTTLLPVLPPKTLYSLALLNRHWSAHVLPQLYAHIGFRYTHPTTTPLAMFKLLVRLKSRDEKKGRYETKSLTLWNFPKGSKVMRGVVEGLVEWLVKRGLERLCVVHSVLGKGVLRAAGCQPHVGVRQETGGCEGRHRENLVGLKFVEFVKCKVVESDEDETGSETTYTTSLTHPNVHTTTQDKDITFALTTHASTLQILNLTKSPSVANWNYDYIPFLNPSYSSHFDNHPSIPYDPFLTVLPTCTSLHTLILSGSHTPHHHLTTLLHIPLPTLRHLDLSVTHTTSTHLQPLPTSFPNLYTLNLDNCPEIDDDAIPPLADHPALANLSLSSTEITDVALQRLASGKRGGLRRLCVCRCQGVGDMGLVAVGMECRGLQVLDVGLCPGVTDVGVKAVLRGVENALEVGTYHESSSSDDDDDDDCASEMTRGWMGAASSHDMYEPDMSQQKQGSESLELLQDGDEEVHYTYTHHPTLTHLCINNPRLSPSLLPFLLAATPRLRTLALPRHLCSEDVKRMMRKRVGRFWDDHMPFLPQAWMEGLSVRAVSKGVSVRMGM
ncbi:hypothetical protein HDU85_007306 [Gaertneriomyces sp. JEL0708]|nr:hypothetical protein HDU85_007306 [Gaertneriomyces sp. JEL0708]